MNAPVFLAFSGCPSRLRDQLATLVPPEGTVHRLNRRIDLPDLVIYAAPDAQIVRMASDAGLVLGRMFARQGNAPISFLDAEASREAVASGGISLLNSCWGGYVAFLRGPRCGDLAVLRDPSGSVPLYHCRWKGLETCFSVPELALGLPDQAPVIDDEFIRQWLSFPFLRTARTGIRGYQELVPGARLRQRRETTALETAWSPWRPAAEDRQIRDFGEAAARLKKVLLATVPAQIEGADGIALQLSGGLDSSIVAACLAEERIKFRAANFVTRLPDGDERSYARRVAVFFGARLEELHEDELPIELDTGRPNRLRPPLNPVLQPLNRALHRFATEAGVRRFATGAGGDNLFCYLTTASPILDAARDIGWRRALTATMADVAALNDCTVWTAGRFALRKRFSHSMARGWKADYRFLASEGKSKAPDRHPWLELPQGALPGKSEHIRSLVRAQYFIEPETPTGESLVHPLINQPLMELCLSIPTWLWVQGGANRAVARAAFADLLPPDIVRRRTKGRLESMCVRAFEANRERLADLLLEGQLSGNGFIDRQEVASYLRTSGPAADEAYFRIFDLASLELWLRSWRA